jgi:hypothetical protein
LQDIPARGIRDFNPHRGIRKFTRVARILEVIEQALAEHDPAAALL